MKTILKRLDEHDQLFKQLLTKQNELLAVHKEVLNAVNAMGATLKKKLPVFEGQLVGRFPIASVEAFKEVNDLIVQNSLKRQLVIQTFYSNIFSRWKRSAPLAAAPSQAA